jgi:tetratricopeptide (TPR) repeat protein
MGCLKPDTELDSAASIRLKALKINQILGSSAGMADNYGQLGHIYLRQGELRQAEKMLRHALAIEQSRDQTERVAGYYLDLGRVCLKRKAVAQAAELLSKGLDLFIQLDDQEGQVNCLVRLGLAYQQNGNFDQAETRFKAAARILENSESVARGIEAAVYSCLGALYLERSDGIAATKVLNKAHSIYHALGDPRGLGLVFSHLGLAAMLQGQAGTARAFLITAIRTNRRLGLHARTADNLANLGCLYCSWGKIAAAVVMCQKALDLFRTTEHPAKFERTRALVAGLTGLLPRAEQV